MIVFDSGNEIRGLKVYIPRILSKNYTKQRPAPFQEQAIRVLLIKLLHHQLVNCSSSILIGNFNYVHTIGQVAECNLIGTFHNRN